MAINWPSEDRAQVEAGIIKYPAESNHCAALARIIYRLAQPRDERARGVQLSGADDAPWLILKRNSPRKWASHTLVETTGHSADALTGADGCLSEQYLEQYFQFHEAIRIHDVDVFAVDTWIEGEQG